MKARRRRRKAPQPPFVLAVDTSTFTQSVALTANTQLIGEHNSHVGRGHSHSLLEVIDQLLTRASLDVGDLHALVIGLGPGSFTGLRISLALLKGLALTHDVPLLGGSSLRAMALGLASQTGTLVCPLMDARKGEVFSALFRVSRAQRAVTKCFELEPLIEEQAMAPEAMVNAVDEQLRPGDRVVVAGTGLSLYHEIVTQGLRERALLMAPALGIPRALHLCLELHDRVVSGERDVLATLEPRYLRPSEAELGISKSRPG